MSWYYHKKINKSEIREANKQIRFRIKIWDSSSIKLGLFFKTFRNKFYQLETDDYVNLRRTFYLQIYFFKKCITVGFFAKGTVE